MYIKLIPLLLLLTACGGGGSSSPTSSATNNINGTWLSDCIDFEQFRTTYNNNSIQVLVSGYSTSDCSGTPIETENFSGTVDYVGTQATSTCIADKINLKFNNFPVFYDLVCVYQNRLFEGLAISPNDGTSASKRPDEMDLSFSSVRI